MTDQSPSSDEIARETLSMLQARLPASWTATAVEENSSRIGPDLTVEIHAPGGAVGRLVAEVKRIIERRDIPRIAEQLTSAGREADGQGALVAARYLSPGVREELTARGLSFADLTGNVRVALSAPALFIADRGSDTDPWRAVGRPRGTLKGRPAAQVVRALLDYRREWRIKDLIRLSAASVGATYRVVDYLEREALLTRTNDGVIVVEDWRKLLIAWSRDYNAFTFNRVTRWIHPRGLEYGLEAVAGTSDGTYAVTGSIAATEWAPYAPARSAFVYVRDHRALAHEWGLRATDTAPNFLLIEPDRDSDFPFVNTHTISSGVVVAAAAQVAVDLMNGPGRNPSEAEHLLAWMSANEESWRR